MNKLNGSCNCNAVNYQVTGDVKRVVNCHCGLCRKMNGSAFSTYVAVLTSEFHLLRGELAKHRVSDNATKYFCKTCGTPVYNQNPYFKGLTILHYGSLDNGQGLTPDLNIFCDSEVAWLAEVKSGVNLPQGIDG